MKLPFTFYVHSNYSSSEKAAVMLEALEKELPVAGEPAPLPSREDLQGKIRFLFEEVTLKCLYDTETGEVTLESASI